MFLVLKKTFCPLSFAAAWRAVLMSLRFVFVCRVGDELRRRLEAS